VASRERAAVILAGSHGGRSRGLEGRTAVAADARIELVQPDHRASDAAG
jgi:hypothetical protein